MSGRRVRVPAAVLAVVLGLATPASADATDNPYDSSSINAGIRLAPLAHTRTPNYVTTDVVVTKRDGTPPTANYRVFLTFHEPGKDPTDNPAQCPQEHRDDPEVPREIYRCTSIVSHPGLWEFTGAVTDLTDFQRVLKGVSITLDIRDAVVLERESWRPLPVVSTTRFEVLLLGVLVAALAVLALSGMRRPN